MDIVSSAKDKILQNVSYPTVCCAAIVSLYLYYKIHVRDYWDKLGIKGERPWPIIGEVYTMLTKDPLDIEINRSKLYGKVHGYYLIGKPFVSISDPEVIRQICIKDFDAFTDHSDKSWANKYQKHFLIYIKGELWKRTRALMTPTFTSGKIKRMFKLLDGCADDLVEAFKDQLATSAETDPSIVNLRNIYELFTMDAITCCCYGLKLERAHQNGSSSVDLKSAAVATRDDFVQQAAKHTFSLKSLFASKIFPKWLLRMINFELAPTSRLEPLAHRLDRLIDIRRNSPKKTSDFLQSLVDARLGDEIELNEMDEQENHHAGLTGESLISDQQKMIAELKGSAINGNENSNGHQDGAQETTITNAVKQQHIKLSDIEVISEALLLLIAGLETTSILLTDCSYLLAFHQDVQERLYEEIKKIVVVESGAAGNEQKSQFDYDSLTSCKYLDAVISETLRILTPAPRTDRQALRDYKIEKYNVHLPKGAGVTLAIHAVHNDPDYWSEPSKFNPDRFMPGQREKIIPGSYAPFSMGPRHCIGMRFSLTEAKLGLAKVVMQYRFEPAPGTQFPPRMSPKPGLMFMKKPLARVIPRH